MLRPSRSASLVFVWGLSVLLGGWVLYYPGDSMGIAGGLRWLTLLTAVVLGGGLLWYSIRLWRRREDTRRQNRGPALIVGIVGLLVILGSVPILRPWAYDGLAGGMRLVGLDLFLVSGGLFIALGVYCYRTQNQRLPLTVLAGLTGAGVFYPLDASGVTAGMHPFLWVTAVALLVGGPALAVYYRWSPSTETSTSTTG